MKSIVLSVVLALGFGLLQAREKPPAPAGSKNAPETAKKEFAFIAPGEGSNFFSVNEAFPENNNVFFKWTPKAASAALRIKTADKLLDEITVKNTDHIKLNLTKYKSYKSLDWTLTVSESKKVMEGVINLRVYNPPLSYLFEMK